MVRVGGESGSEADHPAAADQLINAEVAEKVLAEVAGRCREEIMRSVGFDLSAFSAAGSPRPLR